MTLPCANLTFSHRAHRCRHSAANFTSALEEATSAKLEFHQGLTSLATLTAEHEAAKARACTCWGFLAASPQRWVRPQARVQRLRNELGAAEAAVRPCIVLCLIQPQ